MSIPARGYNLSVVINILIFAGLLLTLLQPLVWNVELPNEFWIRQGVVFVIWVTLFYLNSEVFVPKFLFQKKNGIYIGTLILAVVGAVLLLQLIEAWLHLPELLHKAFHPNSNDTSKVSKHRVDMFMIMATMLVLGISTSITVVRKWQKDAELRQSMEQEKTTSELSFLKAQINPHFFFNTLHSIYALTSIDVEKAKEALYTLSHMMRYVLYDTQSGSVSLSKEIAFIKDYIKLMQLRLTEKVEVSFEYPEILKDLPVAPMLLLPFIENAFKHGVSALHSSYVVIRISQEKSTLNVEVRNSVFGEKRTVLEESSGIGLANTSRRLELLYPNRFNLMVNESEKEFKVQLHLDLS